MQNQANKKPITSGYKACEEKFTTLEKGGKTIRVPLVELKTLRGALKGISTEGLRDETERFE